MASRLEFSLLCYRFRAILRKRFRHVGSTNMFFAHACSHVILFVGLVSKSVRLVFQKQALVLEVLQKQGFSDVGIRLMLG